MSTSYTITGVIKSIGKTEAMTTKKGTEFRKRDAVIEFDRDTQYPQCRKVQFTQDRCDILDGYKVADEVTVYVNLGGREYDKKDGSGKEVFNTDTAWRIQRGAVAETPTTAAGNDGNDVPF